MKPPAAFFDMIFEEKININDLIDIANLNFDLQINSGEEIYIVNSLLETINETKVKLDLLSNRTIKKPKNN